MTNNNIKVKERKSLSKQQVKNLILTFVFILLSFIIGYIIASFGEGKSFIEKELDSMIITLFGFGLSSSVFISQLKVTNKAVNDDENEKKKEKVIFKVAKSLFLTFVLVGSSFIFDFMIQLCCQDKIIIIITTCKYATLLYSFFCLVDVLYAFLKILKAS